MRGLIVMLTMTVSTAIGQGIEVEYDKNRDFSRYTTFRIGEGEVVTPKETLQVNEAQLHQWMRDAIITKLTDKGLKVADSSAHLVATYVIGSQQRNEQINLGPQLLGNPVPGNTPSTPGSPSRTWSRDFHAGNVIIDLHDTGGNLVWRVRATTGGEATDNEHLIREVVNAGFKKFSLKPKHK